MEVMSGRPTGTTASSVEDGQGSGLIGLAERLALVGGELEHEPNANGDFVLRAILPSTP